MKKLITNFYKAFDRLDAENMAACYHQEVNFEDPAFGELHGEHAKNMWRMLCKSQQGKDFRVEVGNVRVEGDKGYAHWEAYYTFGQTGRKIHNKIEAEFRFENGKIIEHIDRFNLYKWSKQAMGITGLLIGWTPFFRKKINNTTRSLLEKFEAKL